jgi:competence protein ComEC
MLFAMRTESPMTAFKTPAWLFTPALLGCLLGSALQLTQSTLWSMQIYQEILLLALAVQALAALVLVANYWRWWVTLLCFSSMALGLTGWRALTFSGSALAHELEGRDIAITGLVAAMAQRTESAVRFRFDVESAQLDQQNVVLPKKLELSWYSGVFAQGDGAGEMRGELQRLPAPLQAGERWQFTVRLKAPHGGLNPYGFDYELWQWEQGVQATGYVRASAKDPQPILWGQSWRHPVQWARGHVRDLIFQRVDDVKAAGLIAALVVGDQGAIERADWDVFRATGVAHLMSISGLHITMFSWLAALLTGWLWRRSGRLCLRISAPSAALLGGLLLATAYALFSGWGVPAQRTVLMLACVSVLRLLGLRWPWPQVWLWVCAVVVIADPWALLQAGFWLSFVAVGILFATEYAAVRASLTSVRSRFVAIFKEQWVITLALSPLSLLLFGQVSLVGLLANALAIPWVTLVVTPLAMLGVLFSPLWDLAVWAIGVQSVVLQGFAGLPFANVSVAQAPVWAGFVAVLGGLLLALPLAWPWRLLGMPMVLPLIFWQVSLPPESEFELIAADIGQGNAVLVRTAKHALLYDAGPSYSRESDAGHRVLVPLLRALDVQLDTLVLSHRDSDHTGGAVSVLQMQPQAQVLSSIEPTHALQSVRAVQACVAGQRWQWDGVNFEVLHPQASDYADVHKTNAMSCTLRISNGAQTVLLAGDIELAQETHLVLSQTKSNLTTDKDFNRLKAQVLLVPHHGSKTSSSADFLDSVQPRIALVQAGYRNRFGHPAQSVLVRYQERRIALLDSPHCGAMTWRSWQAESVQCQRLIDRRYWHHQLTD